MNEIEEEVELTIEIKNVEGKRAAQVMKEIEEEAGKILGETIN